MKTTLSILHNQASDWLRDLVFYTEELGILTERLDEVRMYNTGKEIDTQTRYFQNKFVALRQQTDVLVREIMAREKKVEKTTEEMPDRIDEIIRVVDDQLFDRMALLAKGVAATRYEFNRFLSKVM